VTFLASVSESATGSDVIVGRPLWEPIDDDQTANWTIINNTQSSGWTNIDAV
jgi:hypothetical protein